MKIAFLLTLYNNPEQANIFIEQLLAYEGSVVFIHIDKKSMQIKDRLIQDERVIILPKSYLVEWGDFSQIESVLALMEFAAAFDQFDYYSVHSGSDLAIKPICELADYLKKDHKYAYTACKRLPDPTYQYGGGLGRIALDWPKCFRKKRSGHSPVRYLRSLYGRLYGIGIIRGKKLPDDIVFYGQSDWYTLRSDCVENLLIYVREHPEYLDLFRNSLIGGELFFVTFAHMNKTAVTDSDNNLRYIDFYDVDPATPGSPKSLKMEDYDKIMSSKYFFARKFDLNSDPDVIARIVNAVKDMSRR